MSVDVGAVVNRYMDPCAMHLDAWASVRLARAGGASAVEWEDVFPNVEEPDPLPFPTTARGETIIHPEEVEEGSDKKYGKARKDSESLESMTATVERAIEGFQGPCYLRDLLCTVHPETGRCRPSDYPDDPFAAFSEKECGPNLHWKTKHVQAQTFRHVYRQFRGFLRLAIKNCDDPASDRAIIAS